MPPMYDVGTRDNASIMDVAVFRLSKNRKRENTIIRYDLSDGFVEVSSGPYGMASVWDYDIVLMVVSHLTDAMNRFREGRGEMPPEVFKPHVADILKFCRREYGGHQKDALVGALMRLYTTTVLVERAAEGSTTLTSTKPESLLGSFNVISNTKTKKIEYVELSLPSWMYKEITQGTKPDVLTVHPDYFLIDPALGRFLYRLARKAAGKEYATWGFDKLYMRSGSAGSVKEFNRMLREIIEANDLPEYHLVERDGLRGPMLVMTHRASMDYLKNVVDKADPPEEDESA